MLKNTLEEIRNKVLEDRREKEKQKEKEHLEKICQKFSEIISKLKEGLIEQANQGYNSFTLKNVENVYVSDEFELHDWARSEKIGVTFKRDAWGSADRSKIKVTEIKVTEITATF